jgi:serine/threonine protein kinase
LEKAHRSGVVHRDLKPGNIMLTKSGAKLMDSGLAKPTLQVATSVSGLSVTVSTPAASQPLTAQGTVLGTFQYMSPEQAEGREADERSDIFSLGTVLYEMLTGKRAFEGKTAASVMAAVLERDPALVSSIQPAIPAALNRTADLWSLPADGGVSSRLTYGKGWKAWSVWSPDGKYIAHSAESDGKATLVRRPADGSGSEETLVTLEPEFPYASVVDWSPDGRYLSYYAFSTKKGRGENWIVPLFADRKPFQVAPVGASQYEGNFSPDGHWLAYFSYESGRPEVYVVPFPGPGGKYQISRAGGWNLRWGSKNQLYFLTTGNQLVEADLNLTPQALQVKALRPLFQMNLLDEAAPLFDISADGRRFLMVTPARAESNSIGLVLNWSSLAATKK